MAYEEDFEDSSYSPATEGSDQSYVDNSQSEAIPAAQGSNEQPTDWGVPDDYGQNPVPQEGAEPEQGDSSLPDWLREGLAYTRSLFGINEEAVPTGTEGEGDATPPPPEPPAEGGVAGELSRTDIPSAADMEKPALTPESGMFDVAGAALGKAAGQVGGAIKDFVAPTETDRALEKPQTGPIKQMLLDYVMGRGAETNDQRKQREAQVAANADPNQPLTKSAIREEALKQAFQQGGDAGAAALQNYRQNQQTYRGMAAAALDHGDREGAAKLFNESHTFVPDGQHAAASPTANGVMITTQTASGQTQAVMLSDPQFRELLQKTPGEMDHLTERGLNKMLAEVSRSPGMPAATPTAAPGGAPAPGNAPAAAPAAQPSSGITRPDGSKFGISPVAAATAIGGQNGGRPAGQQGGQDKDGWPAGVPRGGQFANTRGTATRDYSEPIKLGSTGHVSSVGKAGSKPVYDARGQTYDVGKDGRPVAKEGQSGFRPPAQGQPNWNGAQSDKINTRQGGDPHPRVLNTTPATRADARAEDRRYAVDQRSQNQAANRDLKREQGDRNTNLKERDLDRKTQQGDARIGQGQQRVDQSASRLEQNARRLDQGDTRIDQNQRRYDQQAVDKAADRMQRMDKAAMDDTMRTIDSKMKDRGYKSLDPEEKAFRDMVRQRGTEGSLRSTNSEPARSSAAPAASQPSGGGGEWRVNQRTGERKWFAQ